MTAVLALKDVSRFLGVQPYRIQHAFIIGAVPEPERRISGRRIFEAADVQRLAVHFKVKIADETATKPIEA